LATALDKAFENIDCMIAILCCQAKNRFYESTQRLIQPRRVLWSFAKIKPSRVQQAPHLFDRECDTSDRCQNYDNLDRPASLDTLHYFV
jgi:hypothetical protein